MRIAAILVAAGSGTRFGNETPKQFMLIAGIPVIRHAAEALAAHVSLLQPVGDPQAIKAALRGITMSLPVVPGGETRQDSVRAGLEALVPHAPDIVLVHDAARPFIPEGTIPALLAALRESPGAIPAAPVADTLKRVVRGVITETVPRTGLFRAQTPQAFRFQALLAAHRSGLTEATDDASLLEAANQTVEVVPGSDDNIKLTYPEDLIRLERIMAPSPAPSAVATHTLVTPALAAPALVTPALVTPALVTPALVTPAFTIRVGTGFDVHVLEAGRPLFLCGVQVPHEKGLAGHSDADVGIHALCDAIYGALAEGDIGRHFPPSEATWKDADSARFLSHAAERIAARGGRLANADVTLICERPKITPHAPAMTQRLAALLGVDPGRISVKATTTERLGFTGRGEGIAAQAVVSILVPE
jgi:2-C-methyl-D-erythritol 4-phosphate cytidylyltransferase/2-C-methyl-D-erythritol 2,4-cyclodiphosphate synthase